MKTTQKFLSAACIATFIAVVLAGASSTKKPATVTTNKSEYSPGDTVTITGSGFAPNEGISLHIVDGNQNKPWDSFATPDAFGNFSNSQFAVQQDFGGAFSLTATGLSSSLTATTTFTSLGPAAAGIAPDGDPGLGFHIQGGVVATLANTTDWLADPTVSGTTGVLDNNCPTPTFMTCGQPLDEGATFRVFDPYNGGDDVFSTSAKINDNPSAYFWNTSGANNKTDMNNVFVHISTDSVGDRWVTASADRLVSNGTAYVDFELNQAEVMNVADTNCSNSPCGHFATNPAGSCVPTPGPLCATGGRTPNDILVTAGYGNGGSAATIAVFQWKLVSGTYQWAPVTVPSTCGPAMDQNCAYVATNIGSASVPYGAFGKTTYDAITSGPGKVVANQFVEMSLDITQLIKTATNACEGITVKTVFVKTKTSTSTDAQLMDFAAPIPVSFGVGFTVSATGQNPKCSTDTGSITATFSGGTSPYQCALDTGAFADCTSPVTYPISSSGQHTVTVKDSSLPSPGCSKTSNPVTITIPSAVVASSSNTAILCNGGSSTVTVSATGGTAPYTGTGTFSRSAGTYSFTVTDANSCTATTTGTITQPNAVVASSSNTAILCNGGSSTVTVSATGGTAPYTGTGTFSRSAGTYSFTVTDANSCTSTTTGTITQPSAVVASSSNTAILCNGGSSTVTVSATGGTAPYTGTGTFSRSAGTYSFTVTDANSCTATTTGTITQPSAVVASSSNTAILCNGGSSTVTVSATGGTAPYTGTGTFSRSAGTYSFTVTDANSCTATTTGNITQPNAVAASSSNTAILCNGGSSTVTVSATGGTAPYTGTGTFSRSAGTYSFTVTDANSCTSTTTGTITQPSAVVASSSNTAILCNGGSSIVTVSATGGTAPYSGTGTFSRSAGTYSFTVTDANSCTSTTTGTITQPSAVVASSSNTAILCNGGSSIVTVSATGGTAPYSGTGTFSRSAGTYSFTVTDANSCTATTTGTITQPSAVVASSSNTAILCNGGSSIVTVSATGGTAPYSGTGTFSRSAGTYSFTVTDANSCTATTTGTITQPNAVVASSSNTAILCNGGSSIVTVSATGGTAPYTGTGTFSRSAGTYSFTVTDANSCTSTTTGTITQPTPLTLSLGVVACSSGSNGSISATFSGGTPGYNCSLDGGMFTPCSSGQTYTGLTAASHTVTVQDSNLCTKTDSIIVNNCGCPTPVTSSITSNFNGTSISPSNYIWFNANFKASGIQNGTIISFTNSSLDIVLANGTHVMQAIPDGMITFSSTYTCATTTFSGGKWMTTVPLSGSDEIFLSGLLVKAGNITSSDLKGATVTWTGDFSTSTSGLTLSWKWGAAVYKADANVVAAAGNPSLIGVKPTHTNACGFNGSDHAGTPMNLKKSVIGGARGGGGSNFTGSWSGTNSVTPCVNTPTGSASMSASSLQSSSATTASNICPASGSLRTLTMTYEGRNAGGGTVTGNPGGLDAAYIVVSGGSSNLFSGAVSFDSTSDPNSAYFVIDAGRNRTLPAQVTVTIYTARGGANVSTVSFDTSCKQPINVGDYFGSLRVSTGSQ